MQGRQCFTAVMLLVSLSVTAFATADSAETTPAAVEDWKAARLEQLKARLEALVADGSITQEQADAFLAQVEERMAIWASAAFPPAMAGGAVKAVAWAASDRAAKGRKSQQISSDK